MHNKCMGLYGNLSGLSTHRRLSSCAAVLGPRYKRPERQGSPGKVLPEKLGGIVRPASQNPYYLWPKSAIFNTLFMT